MPHVQLGEEMLDPSLSGADGVSVLAVQLLASRLALIFLTLFPSPFHFYACLGRLQILPQAYLNNFPMFACCACAVV